MKNATHTPGPWKLETVPTSCGICHKIGEFPNIRTKLNGEKSPPSYACVYVDNGDGFADVMLANARLMAAAPDLLTLLSEFAAEDSQVEMEYFRDLKNRARAVIRKATEVSK